MSTPIKHPSLYLDDGDVILSAATSEGQSQLFCVHKSLLSYHSPVFSSMFTLTPPPDIADPTIDGIPVVTLQDMAEDIESLLNMLYTPATAWNYERLHPDNPMRITGILRITNKYEVDAIHSMILQQFERDWPRSTEEHWLLEQEWKGWKERYGATRPVGGKIDGLYLDDRFPEPVSAINLAREFGCTSILPYAFYMLAQIDPRMSWDDARKTDGVQNVKLTKRLARGERSARWNLLSRDDLHRLYCGVQSLQEYGARLTLSIINLRKPHAARCKSGDIKQRLEALKSYPIEILECAHATPCRSCRFWVQKEFSAEHGRLWEFLTASFNLI